LSEEKNNRPEETPEERPETEAPVEEVQDVPEDPSSVEVSGEAEEEGPELAQLREELESVRRERDEYLETLKRLKAEFENTRKRQERERERIVQMASERLVRELLPVLDNLDRALESEGDIREGVRVTREQLVGVLEEEGLIPVASDGQHFDPNVHEAVMSQPSEEHEEGVIVQTFQRGYMLNGRPIRPAKVVVASRQA
jgi:molecular chaperone GrpE